MGAVNFPERVESKLMHSNLLSLNLLKPITIVLVIGSKKLQKYHLNLEKGIDGMANGLAAEEPQLLTNALFCHDKILGAMVG